MLRLGLGISFAFAIAFVTVSCIYFRKLRTIRVFFVYGIVLISAAFAAAYTPPLFAYHTNFVINVFLLAEFLICFSFIRQLTRSDEAGRIALFLQQVFPLAFVYTLMYVDNSAAIHPVLFSIHHALICVGCLLLYRDFFLYTHTRGVFSYAPLMAVNGIMCYSLICFVFSAAFFSSNVTISYEALQLKFIAGATLFTWLFAAVIHELKHP